MGKRNRHWHMGNNPNDHTLPAGDVARALKASRAALRQSGHETWRTLGEIPALRVSPPPVADPRTRASTRPPVTGGPTHARREQEEENGL